MDNQKEKAQEYQKKQSLACQLWHENHVSQIVWI